MMLVAKKKNHWVGFDLGGTNMMACVYDGDLKLKGTKRRNTKGRIGVKAGLKRIATTIHEALGEAGIKPDRLAGIGVGCPGPLDLDRGVILETPDQILRQVDAIHTQAVASKAMPLGNLTQMTDAERGQLRRWIEDGAEGP